MKVTSNILRYLGLPLSFFALSTLQAAQISDKERHLLNQTNTRKDDEKTDNQDELDKAFLKAAKKGDLISLKKLKNKGANVHAKTQSGNNALHLAALYETEGKGIAWLIDQANISIESKGQYQMTPFLCAAQKNNLAGLKILKNKGASIHAKTQSGNNALHLATFYALGDKVIRWLIHKANISIESKGQYQMTPFLCAAEKGNLVSLKLLKNKGANVKFTDEYHSNALHFAAMYAPEGEGIVWLICSAHLSIESKGNDQATPFLCAAEKGNLPALKILKNNGAKTNATDQYGYNALHFAAMYASEGNGINWLIDEINISIESRNNHQKTPFLCAAEKSNLLALKLLKNKGANVHATDQDDENALHFAAYYAPAEVVAWLIHSANLSIESKNNDQKTPFLCAAEEGNLPALKILKDNSANINATDEYGNNALVYAKEYSNSQETIDWLQDVCELTE